MTKWINVKKRLPELPDSMKICGRLCKGCAKNKDGDCNKPPSYAYCDVLVTGPEMSVMAVMCGRSHKNEIRFFNDSDDITKYVTLWMPYPKSPYEKE